MWSSMSSSMQLAQDCLGNEDLELGSIIQESNAMEGLERVAQTIDNGGFSFVVMPIEHLHHF